MVGNDGTRGKGFPTVGNHFPQWGTISHGGKSFSTVGFPACLPSRHPRRLDKGAVALGHPSFVDIPMDGCLEARQAGNPTVENDFPPWEMVSHRGKWFPTVGNHFPPWDIISYCFSLFFRPYIFEPYKRFPEPQCHGANMPAQHTHLGNLETHVLREDVHGGKH